MNENYSDIINLKHPTSKKHPRMPIYKRAAQFAPFAALTGYSEAVSETARGTNNKRELTNEEKIMLSEELKYIQDNFLSKEEVEFIYFIPDKRKSGGKYINKKGIVRKIDLIKRKVIFIDRMSINIDDIIRIKFK